MRVSDEESFINAILATPDDVSLRLVYADWLEERGDEDSNRRAEYLRVECELDGLSTKAPRHRPLLKRLAQLRGIRLFIS